MTPRLGTASVIAVWGAPTADREQLVDALARRFVQRGIRAIALVGMAPTDALECPPAPTDALAQAQAWRTRIDQARHNALVVAAGSPIALLAQRGVPVESWPPSLVAAERGHAFTLLLPPQDAAGNGEQDLDARLRAGFAAVGLPCAIIHGRDAAQHLSRAWSALQAGLEAREEAPATPRHLRAPAWNCERCSDPDCEHRLFTDLIAARQTLTAG
ncbi:hypothetical protein [Pseudacidovorax intermedius]|uniref:hypothetical protein n=1 Tax=Pseudacidovorax intermedius TaxID=433924 RepID=UPI0005C289C8|nr:hypothetical protein [Pseudacidovorax intermedius]